MILHHGVALPPDLAVDVKPRPTIGDRPSAPAA